MMPWSGLLTTAQEPPSGVDAAPVAPAAGVHKVKRSRQAPTVETEGSIRTVRVITRPPSPKRPRTVIVGIDRSRVHGLRGRLTRIGGEDGSVATGAPRVRPTSVRSPPVPAARTGSTGTSRTGLDFRLLFESVPGLYLVLDPDLT